MVNPVRGLTSLIQQAGRGGETIEVGAMNGAVTLNRNAVLNGWALWPIHFDPVWVVRCTLPK